MTGEDFKRIRAKYGETQEAFGRRLGYDGLGSTVTRKIARYERNETPIVGPLLALMNLLDKLPRKPDTRRRPHGTSTKGESA